MPENRRLKRAALIIWLLAPFFIVGSLYFLVDRSKGRPDPRRTHTRPPATDAATPFPGSEPPTATDTPAPREP